MRKVVEGGDLNQLLCTTPVVETKRGVRKDIYICASDCRTFSKSKNRRSRVALMLIGPPNYVSNIRATLLLLFLLFVGDDLAEGATIIEKLLLSAR